MGLSQELQEPSGLPEVRSTTTSPAAAAPPASASSLMVFEGHRGEALPGHSVVLGLVSEPAPGSARRQQLHEADRCRGVAGVWRACRDGARLVGASISVKQ